jgi:hypothetical protein
MVFSASLPLGYCSPSPLLAPFPVPVGHGDERREWPSSSRCRRFSRVAPVGALLVRKCEGPSTTAHACCCSTRLPSPGPPFQPHHTRPGLPPHRRNAHSIVAYAHSVFATSCELNVPANASPRLSSSPRARKPEEVGPPATRHSRAEL